MKANGSIGYMLSNWYHYSVYQGVTGRNFLYAGVKRNITSRSEVTVAVKTQESNRHEISAIVLSHGEVYGQVPQLAHYEQGKFLFNNYKKRIVRATKKVQEVFSLTNMAKAYCRFDLKIQECKKLEINKNLSINLFNLICDPCYLLIAYSSLKRAKGEGIDDIPVGNVILQAILSLSKQLRCHHYKPKPSKRISIRKANGKMRPLSIASTRDKVVQQAINLLLIHVYEPIFKNCSHGFRPNRSCHSVLNEIFYQWKRPIWFIKADIKGCFDEISHLKLLSAISKRINDYWFLRLLSSILKAGFIHFEGLVDSELESSKGTPQGSILSPVLCNILLHDFDKIMVDCCISITNQRVEKISEEYLKATSRYVGEKWENTWNTISRDLAPDVSNKSIRKHLRTRRTAQAAQNGITYLEEDKNYRKLHYIRYADDFLLGFIGPKKESNLILIKIAHNLDLLAGLNLNIEKSNVVHHKKGVLFLGYKIWGFYTLNIKWDKKRNQRFGGTTLKLSIPVSKMWDKYADRGFFQKAKKGKANKYVSRRLDKLLFTPDYEIVNNYNSITRGIQNYYPGATHQHTLYEFYSTLRRSCALTLAHRHKKRKATWAYDEYGENLRVKHHKHDKYTEFYLPKANATQKNRFKKSASMNLISKKLEGWKAPVTLSAICSAEDLECAIPNCLNQASDWHHINHRKKFKGTSSQKIKSNLFAKQIPICKAHHVSIHGGKYDGPSLRKLKGFTPESFRD